MENCPPKQLNTDANMIMNMTLAQIHDEAAITTQDKRNHVLSFEWESEEFLIEVKITKKSALTAEELLMQIPNEKERYVVNALANGSKQVELAEQLSVSQAAISSIKKKHTKTLSAMLAITAAATLNPFAEIVAGTLTKAIDLANKQEE